MERIQLYRNIVSGRMLLFLVLAQFIFNSLSAQPAINKMEYYLDNDPGYGNATDLSYVGTTDATATINISLVPLSQGVHIVGVRSRDLNGAWSLDNRWLFVKPYSSNAVLQPNINRVEWYLDNDPGYGNGNALTISAAQDIPGLFFNIDMIPLIQGVHIVGVRSRDANGAWSLDNRWLFVKPYSSNATLTPNITRVEWFLDNDPGYGNATSIPIVSSQDPGALSFNIDMVPLSQGVHIVGLRSEDANGAWSLDNRWLFVKPYSSNVTTQPNINRVEWYLDNDPGYGNGTPISISAATDLPGLVFNISLTSLYKGVHIAGVRSRDANGAWSLDNKWIFLVPFTASNFPPNIVRMEYYVDIDPGFGNASTVTITPGTDIPMLIFDADITTVPNGVHKLGIRSMDANGAWSLDNKVDFTGGTGNSWVGLTNSDWYTATNWSRGVVPTSNDHVSIFGGTPFSLIIPNSVTANCKSIKVYAGATVTLAAGGHLLVGQ